MKISQKTQLNQNQWNSDRLIKFSQHLVQAYGVETNLCLDSSQKNDNWTAEKSI